LKKLHCRHHLIVWISDQFVTPADSSICALAKTNDIVFITLFDPFEMNADITQLDLSVFSLQDHTKTYYF
jgi:hypothetical protein